MSEKADWQQKLEDVIEKRARMRIRKEKNDKIIIIVTVLVAANMVFFPYFTTKDAIAALAVLGLVWVIITLFREIVFSKKERDLVEEARGVTNPENTEHS